MGITKPDKVRHGSLKVVIHCDHCIYYVDYYRQTRGLSQWAAKGRTFQYPTLIERSSWCPAPVTT